MKRFLTISGFLGILLLVVVLGLASSVRAAHIVVPGTPGGPPPGSLAIAIAEASPLPAFPGVPLPGSFFWILYVTPAGTPVVTLVQIPPDPTAPPVFHATCTPGGIPSFTIPGTFVLYDLATGPGNFGLGLIFSSTWILGMDSLTGERRAQVVAMTPGTTPGCFTVGDTAQLLTPPPSVIAAYESAVEDFLWEVLPAELSVEPGTTTPDQRIRLQQLATGLPVDEFDEDSIVCQSGVPCPDFATTFISQVHERGGRIGLLLTETATGAQRVAIGEVVGPFNPLPGCPSPLYTNTLCLVENNVLPTPISGFAVDIAFDSSGQLWVLWVSGSRSLSLIDWGIEKRRIELGGPPEFRMEVPLGQWAVSCRAAPATFKLDPNPQNALPLAVDISAVIRFGEGKQPLQVLGLENVYLYLGFVGFTGPVDIYVAVQLPDGQIFLLNSLGQWGLYPANSVPWRANSALPVNTLIWQGPVSGIPQGTYKAHVVVVLAGTDPAAFPGSASYYWWCFEKTFP